MVATIGPASYNYEETVNTLRYANRAKSIKNKPKINEDPKDAMLRQFQDEINRLKGMLEGKGGVKKGKGGRKSKRVINSDGEEVETFEDDPDGMFHNICTFFCFFTYPYMYININENNV